jgi:phage shock protein A
MMSDGMDQLTAVKERVDRNERRMDQQDAFRHDLRESIRVLETKIAVVITQLDNLSKDVEEQGITTTEKLKSLNKGVYAAATLLIALAGIVLKGQVS